MVEEGQINKQTELYDRSLENYWRSNQYEFLTSWSAHGQNPPEMWRNPATLIYKSCKLKVQKCQLQKKNF
jgi:hypothetical protein